MPSERPLQPLPFMEGDYLPESVYQTAGRLANLANDMASLADEYDDVQTIVDDGNRLSHIEGTLTKLRQDGTLTQVEIDIILNAAIGAKVSGDVFGLTLEAIAQRGTGLITPELEERVDSQLSAVRAFQQGAKTDGFIIDPEGSRTLGIMNIIDLIGHAYSISAPDVPAVGIISELIRFHHLPGFDRARTFSLLHPSGSDHSEEDKARTNQLLERGGRIWQLENLESRLHDDLSAEQTAREATNTGQRRRLEEDLDAVRQEVKDYVDEAPSPDRVFGALVVEEWVAPLFVLDVENKDDASVFPLHNAVKVEAINQLEERISQKEADYRVSGRAVRELDGGLALRRRLEVLREIDSDQFIFNKDAARVVTGLALGNHGSKLKQDVAELCNTWLDLSKLKGGVVRGDLLGAIDTLMELYESVLGSDHIDTSNSRQAVPKKMLLDPQLQPLWQLARNLSQPEESQPAQSKKRQELRDLDPNFEPIEGIKIFPPGTTENEIINDLEARAQARDRREPVQPERISSLLILQTELQNLGYAIRAFQLEQSKWHRLPHYGLEVSAGGKRVAIIESPLYGNASYIIPTHEWEAVVTMSKADARILGAIPKVHVIDGNPAAHRRKLLEEAISHL